MTDPLTALVRNQRDLEKFQVSTHLHMLWAIIAQDTLAEISDSVTRKVYVDRFNEVLTVYKMARALVDFKVVCDDSNNTPEYVDSKAYCKVDVWIKWDTSATLEHFEFPPEGFR